MAIVGGPGQGKTTVGQLLCQVYLPECRRWPVRIALNEFADALAATPSTTVLDFAAKQAHKAGPINRRMLRMAARPTWTTFITAASGRDGRRRWSHLLAWAYLFGDRG
jgi:hypothetical protein